MAIYGALFQTGPGGSASPDSSFQWSATVNANNQVTISCNYGGGTNTGNNVTTDPIDWLTGGTESGLALISTTGPNTQIFITGTITIAFSCTPGGDFVAMLNGAMTLAAGAFNARPNAENIAGADMVVAAQIS
jgi:hypothetical protein